MARLRRARRGARGAESSAIRPRIQDRAGAHSDLAAAGNGARPTVADEVAIAAIALEASVDPPPRYCETKPNCEPSQNDRDWEQNFKLHDRHSAGLATLALALLCPPRRPAAGVRG